MKPAVLLAATLCVCGPVRAQQAVGVDFFGSTDADDTEVTKAGAHYDFRHASIEQYQGIRVETARFTPLGGDTRRDSRVYYRFADRGTAWKWSGMLGSDGHTWLGNAAIHNEAPLRQEYFLEREILETPTGLSERLHSTFAGGAFDLPMGERDHMSVVLGVQDFSGDNRRVHARARYGHVVKPDWGLSAQLRMRAWHDSHPREYDYYAPGWYAEVLPTLQMRRFRGGWQYLAVAAYGRSRDKDSDWRPARYIELGVTSPSRGNWFLKGGVIHSNTPVTNGYTYRYTQLSLQAMRRF